MFAFKPVGFRMRIDLGMLESHLQELCDRVEPYGVHFCLEQCKYFVIN